MVRCNDGLRVHRISAPLVNSFGLRHPLLGSRRIDQSLERIGPGRNMPPATQIIAGVLMLVASVIAAQPVSAQTTIRLYDGVAPRSESWTLPEQSISTPFPGITGIANISEPTLTVFRPKPGTANGTAVIVAPGGGFHFLVVDGEGSKVAEWLIARGVTAFVLKYRVLQTTKAHQDTMFKEALNQSAAEHVSVFPLSVADAKRAVSYVRAAGEGVRRGFGPNRDDRLQRGRADRPGCGCVIRGKGGA